MLMMCKFNALPLQLKVDANTVLFQRQAAGVCGKVQFSLSLLLCSNLL